ncbi:hypothetical protein, partial [Geobacillus sp.]|uniref:hypothetical protein n=1 Tax=Geobacillus sp. TaxID=1891658 RepID=UPI00257CBBFF
QENWINQQNIALGVLHLIGEHSKWSRSLDTIGFPSIFDTLLSRIQVCKKETTSETLGFTRFFVVVCFSMLP